MLVLNSEWVETKTVHVGNFIFLSEDQVSCVSGKALNSDPTWSWPVEVKGQCLTPHWWSPQIPSFASGCHKMCNYVLTHTHTGEAAADQECLRTNLPSRFVFLSMFCFLYYLHMAKKGQTHTQAHTCPFPISLCGIDPHLHRSWPFTSSKQSVLGLTWAVKYHNLRIATTLNYTHTHTHNHTCPPPSLGNL